VIAVAKKPGRPKGSTNKTTKEVIVKIPGKRGRKPGSKNKPKLSLVETLPVEAVDIIAASGTIPANDAEMAEPVELDAAPEEVEVIEGADPAPIALSYCTGGYTNTVIKPLLFDNFPCLASKFNQPAIGKKDGDYIIRSLGSRRSDKDTNNLSDILFIDGDNGINSDGELMNGLINPADVHQVFKQHNIPHLIYSSFSNGEKGDDYFKFRALIHIQYDRGQLVTLLEHYHELLHNAGVLLFNVKENKSWSQPWYFPRCPAERLHLFRYFEHLNGEPQNADAICASYEAAHPQIKPEPIHRPNPVIKPTYGLEIRAMDAFNEFWKSPVYYLNSEEGYRYRGNRLLPPHCSEDSIAGVQVCQQCVDGIERVYSHHSNDPLSKDGKAHDAFDCFKILRHGGDEVAAIKAIGQSFMVNGMTLEAWNRLQYAKAQTPVAISWDSLAVLR